MLASHEAVPRGDTSMQCFESRVLHRMRRYGEGTPRCNVSNHVYLKAKDISQMVFDPTYPELGMGTFKNCEWKNFYGNVKEAITVDA